jgi:flagellar protein FlaG
VQNSLHCGSGKDLIMSNNISSMPTVAHQLQQAAPAVASPQAGQPTVKADAAAQTKAAIKEVATQEEPRFDQKEAQEQLTEAVDRMNEHMRKNNYNLAFSVDKDSAKVVVKVTNLETGDVVRQIPNEAALRVAHNIEDFRGLLQDKKI